MVNSLRKVDFRTLLASGHYTYMKKNPPLRKSWVRPCI